MDTNELRRLLAHEKERGRKATQVSVAELEALVDALAAKEAELSALREAVRGLEASWREAAAEHERLHVKQTGYEISFEDEAKATTFDRCADELAALNPKE